ncbi:MAG: flagellar type III secretion system protein FlhB, partial [Ferrovum sp.]|nr:flagellar type III secretion system protein FlhB [Ferrovum sp.]
LSTFMGLLAGGGGLWFMGSYIHQSLLTLLRQGLSFDAGVAQDPGRMVEQLSGLGFFAIWTFIPLMGLLVATAVFSPLLLNGWLFSFQPLQPKFSRLDPGAGLARMFSRQSLVELGKSIAKALVVGLAGIWAMWHLLDQILALPGMAVTQAASRMGSLVGQSFMLLLLGMMLVAAVDVPFQLWEHNRRLRMTKEEVRQEAKETEGDPHVKSKIRGMQREMARRRMMAQIPTADVVVTNPTHYAVALRYREGTMRAPIVVAKGVHLVAARIRETAANHQIPVVEAPELARALYAHTDLEHPIPEALYLAVAEILAYAYQLQRQRQEGGVVPMVPQHLPVPPHLDPESRVSAS